jgi:hypothetical protein
MRAVIRTIIAVTLCILAYLTGVYAGYNNAWPVPEMKILVRTWPDRASARTDEFGRLLHDPAKVETPCPVQDANTAALLVLGQSNAANYQGQRHQSADDRVVNFSAGHCYIAGSPLLGADGHYGESWTLLGTKLVNAGMYTKVVLVVAALGSTSVGQWAPGGNLNSMLLGVIRDAREHFTFTGVLWNQGATDFSLHTPEDVYRSKLKSLIDMIRAEGVPAPIYITRSSLQLSADWSEDNPISRAQVALVDGKSIFAGPNTDHDVRAIDRFDGLHFGASGQEKFTDAWLRLLAAQHPTKP